MKRLRGPSVLTTRTTSRSVSRVPTRICRPLSTASSSAARLKTMRSEGYEGNSGAAPHFLRLAAAALLLALAGPACAKPELHPAADYPIPAQMQAGQQNTFRVIYKDAANDRPRSATLVLDGPGGRSQAAP